MGMFKDFAKAFKDEMQETPKEPLTGSMFSEVAQPAVPILSTYNGYVNLPYLVHQCMTCGAVDVLSTKYFTDTISRLPILTRLEFKLLKANKKTTPDGWNFDPGDVSVFTEGGQFIGIVNERRFKELGEKTGKRYGFVEPPCYDFAEDLPITPTPRVFLFCDFNAIYNGASNVELGWRP